MDRKRCGPGGKVVGRCGTLVCTSEACQTATSSAWLAGIVERHAGRTKQAASSVGASGSDERFKPLDEKLKRNAESLQVANNVFSFNEALDPSHPPAWTKRRRS